MYRFNQGQLDQIKSRGIPQEEIQRQLTLFQKGIDPVILKRHASPGDGVEVFSDEEISGYISFFRERKNDYSHGKFVPASGAATRMFKDLFEAFSGLKNSGDDPFRIIQKFPLVKKFFSEVDKYPFFNEFREVCLKKDIDLNKPVSDKNYFDILDLLLNSSGLNYGNLPKGLLKFFSYENEIRTPFEEHLVEASSYLKDINGCVNIHFTVAPEHRNRFEQLARELTIKYSVKGLADFKINFSEQKPSTDTLAVTMQNEPFLISGNSLLFRPGGHGALLDNLQDIDFSIVFIGNIDNVSNDLIKPLRVKYKELLGGILLQRVDKLHSMMKRLEKGTSDGLRKEITGFINKYISSGEKIFLESLPDKDFNLEIFRILNKPCRVCGMVKNTGEPGGGPFWIESSKGHISKQIIESSQIDMSDPDQKKIFNSSTHFNPVDIACFTRDFRGNKINLKEFCDPGMAFIAKKSHGGKDIKALELPGLWNGAMAGWITFFVEVPGETFSPVKTVFDLLRSDPS